MKRVIIVGAKNFARELLSWIKDCPQYASEWEVAGFLSDYPDDLKERSYDLSIIGTIKEYVPDPTDRLVMGIGTPAGKLSVGRSLLERGCQFISVIHPTAIIGANVSIGTGCVVCPYVVITCDVEIHDFVALNVAVTVGHDAVIDDGCTLSSHSDVTGFARLGQGVFVGSHGTVAPHVEVGDFATIGIGSAVIRRVRPRTTVMGVPARRI